MCHYVILNQINKKKRVMAHWDRSFFWSSWSFSLNYRNNALNYFSLVSLIIKLRLLACSKWCWSGHGMCLHIQMSLTLRRFWGTKCSHHLISNFKYINTYFFFCRIWFFHLLAILMLSCMLFYLLLSAL